MTFSGLFKALVTFDETAVLLSPQSIQCKIRHELLTALSPDDSHFSVKSYADGTILALLAESEMVGG